MYMSYTCSAQEVFLNLPLRLDILYGYSPNLIWFGGLPENSGEKYLSSRQGKVVCMYFFPTKWKDFHLFKSLQTVRESKTKHKPKRIPQQSAMLCSSYLFFTGSFKGLAFILFWNGDKYWNLLLPSPQKTFSPISIWDKFSGKSGKK